MSGNTKREKWINERTMIVCISGKGFDKCPNMRGKHQHVLGRPVKACAGHVTRRTGEQWPQLDRVGRGESNTALQDIT
jgi:hypothetical protein